MQLYVTIDVQDTKEAKTDLVNADGTGKLTFSGKTGDVQYELNLPLFSEIDVEASKVSESPRHIFLVIVKVRVAGAGGCRRYNRNLYDHNVSAACNAWGPTGTCVGYMCRVFVILPLAMPCRHAGCCYVINACTMLVQRCRLT